MDSRLVRLSVEQMDRCFYCLRETSMDIQTIDHVMPKSLGRQWRHFRNEVMACMYCNQAKGNRQPTEQETSRLRVLKSPYAEVDYDLSQITPEPRHSWMQI